MDFAEPSLFTWLLLIFVFAIPGFFFFRFMLPKLLKFGSGIGLNITAAILGLALSPFLGYGAFSVYAILIGFHG